MLGTLRQLVSTFPTSLRGILGGLFSSFGVGVNCLRDLLVDLRIDIEKSVQWEMKYILLVTQGRLREAWPCIN